MARLVDRLATRLDGRTADGAPPVLLVVDGLAAWRQVVAERLGGEVADRLDRVLVEGPAAGIVVAATVDRPGALPLAVSGAVGERLVFRLGDPADALGCSGCGPPRWPTCRAVGPSSPAAASTCRWRRSHDPAAGGRPRRRAVGRPTPRHAAGTAGRPAAGAGGRRAPAEAESWRRSDHDGEAPPIWSLPIGLDGRTLDVCRVELHPGEHLLVAGPARSGRSSALALLAQQVRVADPAARVVALTPRRSPLRALCGPSTSPRSDELAAALSAPRAVGTGEEPRTVLLVDDAELVDDPCSVLLRRGQRVSRAHRRGRRPGRRAALGLRPLDAGAAPAAARAAPAPHVRPRRRRARGHAAPPRSGPGGARAGAICGRRRVRARAARLARSGRRTGARTRLAVVGRTDDTRWVGAVGARDRWSD